MSAIVVALLIGITSVAQIPGMGSGAKKVDQKTIPPFSDRPHETDSSNLRNKQDAPHGDGCLDACCSIGIHTSFLLFNEYHQELLSKEDTIDRISSVEIFFQGGYSPGSYLLAPRIRGNWGFISTDFRYTHILQSSFGQYNSYATFDWQMMVLNLVIIPEFQLRMGGGLLFEQLTGKTFGEFTFGGDLYFNRDYRINAEARYAPPRTEANATLNYRLKRIDRLSTFVSIGGQYARYHYKQDLSTWTFFGGFLFMLE